MKRNWLATVAEICLIVAISAAIGILWNRSLLTSAWRGELAAQAQAQAAPTGEAIPMPLGLMQVKEMYDAKQAVLVDARSSVSFSDGHITGAISLPLETARKHPARPNQKLPAGATIIAYCNGFSCHDSMDLGKILMQAGYTTVYVFEGGFPEWHDAGYPVAKGGT